MKEEARKQREKEDERRNVRDGEIKYGELIKNKAQKKRGMREWKERRKR